ncbi:MAG TPA: protein kinase [Verrucomicrobiales bacterium]|nr:protein kinase [Verrucomicrobiales bacterium]
MSLSPIVNLCPGCGASLKAGASEGLCTRCLFGSLMHPDDEPLPDAPVEVERFGDYELLGVIARGGSGIVYRARHAELDRVAALKILPHEVDGSAEFLERFRNEAAAAASLEHPHIVPVYEYGHHGSRHFLVMKLIEGEPAAQQMEPAVAARRLVMVARAVHHAHQRGVLHRDLKPANILLDAKGEPHLTDFGLAKLTWSDSTITRTRAVLGTPAYMAPEQAAGNTRQITTAADVYGLGAVLYYWLTGGPPFAGGTTVETIRQVMEREPEPPSHKNREVDADLETICLKCLRKEPAARYASADALADDLMRWMRHEPVRARPVSKLERALKWMRRNRALTAVIAISLAALLIAAALLWRQNVHLVSARGEVSNLAEKQRRDLVRLHVATGNRLAAEGDGYAALASFAEAAALDTKDPERLAMHRFRFSATLAQLPAREQAWSHGGPVYSANFNSAGTRVVTASADKTARVWNAETGAAVTPLMPHAGQVWWAGFAAGGARVITRTKTGEVFLWDSESGAPCGGPFTGRGDMPDLRDGMARELAVSPDGASFVLLKEKSVEIRSTQDGRPLREPLPCSQFPNSAAWSADGTRLAVAGEKGELLVFDVRSGALLHSLPASLATAKKAAPIGWRSVAWSPDGSHLALTDRVFTARVLPADVQQCSSILSHHNMVLGSAWSRDSARLLTWSYDNTVRLWEAATLQPAMPAVRNRGPVFDAAFSPDERWIASACRDGTVSLRDPVTGERRGPVLRHKNSAMDVAWSPDSVRLLTSGADGFAQLWKVAGMNGADRECIHKGSVENLAVSPNGTLVAAMALEKEMPVWRMPGGERIASLPHGGTPASAAWLDDTQLLTLTSDGTLRLWDVPAATIKRTAKVPGFSADGLWSLRLSPDARRIAAVFKSRPVALYNTDTAALEKELPGGPAVWVTWSPCNRFVVTLHGHGGGNRIVIHEAASSAAPVVLNTRTGLQAADTGARRLALVDAGYSVTILDRATGLTTPPMPHDAIVQAAVFSPDGRILATGTQDGMLRLWDASTAEPLSPPLPHTSWIMSLASSPDSHRFFTGSNGGILSEWTIPDKNWAPAEMRAIADGAEVR